MKQTTKHTIRRWTGLMLSICIFGLMLPTGVFAEQTNGTAFTYTGNVEDSTYTGDNALGDLVLPNPIELEDGKSEYAALVVEFPDQKGGGKVTMETGNLTSNADPVTTTVDYGHPDYPYPVEWGWGEQEITYESHGLTVKMDDKSTLDLDTGNITNTAGGAAKISVKDQSTLDLETGDIWSEAGTAVDLYVDDACNVEIDAGKITTYRDGGNGIALKSYNEDKSGSTVKISTEDISTNGSGANLETWYGETSFTVDGGIQSSDSGLGVAQKYGGKTTSVVNGDITAGNNGVALDILAEYGSTVNAKAGELQAGYSGLSITSRSYDEYDESYATVETGAIQSAGQGIGITVDDNSHSEVLVKGSVSAGKQDGLSMQNTYDSTTKVTIEGDLYAEDKNSSQGMLVTNGIVRWPDEPLDHSQTDITVEGDVYGGYRGAYLQNNSGILNVTVEGDIESWSDYGVFLKTDDYSTSTVKAKDVYSQKGKGVLAESEGEGSTVNVTVQNIDGWGSDGLYAAAWEAGSKTTIQAGDVFGTDKGVNLCVDNFNSYIHDANGTIDAKVGDVQGLYGGLYANVQNGNITVSAENVQSRDNSGVYISLTGDNKEKGINATINGDVQSGETGIDVSSSENFRYLEDEYGDYIENPDGSRIEVYEKPDNYADVTVKGTVNAGVYGIKTRNEGGEFTIKAENGVSVSHEKEDNPREDLTINGVYAEAKAGKTTITIDKGLEVFGYQHQGGWEAAPEDYDEDDDEVDDDEEDNWYNNSEHVFNGDGVTVQNKGGELDITINGGLSAVDGTAVIMDVPYYWMDSQDHRRPEGIRKRREGQYRDRNSHGRNRRRCDGVSLWCRDPKQ